MKIEFDGGEWRDESWWWKNFHCTFSKFSPESVPHSTVNRIIIKFSSFPFFSILSSARTTSKTMTTSISTTTMLMIWAILIHRRNSSLNSKMSCISTKTSFNRFPVTVHRSTHHLTLACTWLHHRTSIDRSWQNASVLGLSCSDVRTARWTLIAPGMNMPKVLAAPTVNCGLAMRCCINWRATTAHSCASSYRICRITRGMPTTSISASRHAMKAIELTFRAIRAMHRTRSSIRIIWSSRRSIEISTYRRGTALTSMREDGEFYSRLKLQQQFLMKISSLISQVVLALSPREPQRTL